MTGNKGNPDSTQLKTQADIELPELKVARDLNSTQVDVPADPLAATEAEASRPRIELKVGNDLDATQPEGAAARLSQDPQMKTDVDLSKSRDTRTDHDEAISEIQRTPIETLTDDYNTCQTSQEEPSKSDSRPERMDVGTTIAERFVIKSFLGEGGMSAVYKVFDKLIKRDVALKVLHADLIARNKAALHRLQREAQALGKLEHDNIVKIYHFDIDENGNPYIVMDLVEGKSLSYLIKVEKVQLDTSRMVFLLSQVCDALEHAHKRGIVHRDLKPSNIMLCGNQVKILDFGIAKLTDEEDELHVTRTGEICGSPLYMSPEQCRGEKLDNRSDIYSMGCLLYEAYTGSPPFRGNSQLETLLMHINDMPKSVASLRAAKDAPKVEAIILKAMSKRPQDRYQTMLELKQDLQQLEAHNFIATLNNLRSQGLHKALRFIHFWKDKVMTAPVMSAGIFVATLLILVAAVLWFGQLYVASADLVSKVPALKQQWKEEDLKGQEAFNKGDVTAAAAVFDANAKLAEKLDDKQLRLASYLEQLDFDRARKILQSATSDEESTKRSAELEANIAKLRLEERKYFETVMNSLISSSKGGANNETALNDAIEKGVLMTEAGYDDLALQLLSHALTISRKIDDPELIAESYYNIGLCYFEQGDEAKAAENYAAALKVAQQRKLPEYDATKARTLARYAMYGNATREAQMSRLKEALRVSKGAFHATSPKVAQIHYFMAVTLAHEQKGQGGADFGKAKMEVQQAIDICNSALERAATAEDRATVIKILLPALTLRSKIDSKLLDEDTEKGRSIPDRAKREAALWAQTQEVLKLAEQSNPRPYRNPADYSLPILLSAQAHLLDKTANDTVISTNTKVFKAEIAIPAKEDLQESPLTQAKFRMARAIAITMRAPRKSTLAEQSRLYAELGAISRKIPDMKLATYAYEQAVQLGRRSGNSGNELEEWHDELQKCLRDSGQLPKPK